jgi:hypothetical protein
MALLGLLDRVWFWFLLLIVVDSVVVHAEGVFARFFAGGGPVAVGAGEAVEAVVLEALGDGAAFAAGWGDGDVVEEVGDVADVVVGVVEVLEGCGFEVG